MGFLSHARTLYTHPINRDLVVDGPNRIEGGGAEGGVMERAHSVDGTSIAFDRTGAGPALVLVVGGR